MSNEDVSRKISTRIDRKLSGISKISSNQIIFRIDNILRMTCAAAYEPEMVSIGPHHRGKKKLQKMEKYKLKYLQGILKRQNESSARRYIDSLIQDEEKARSYYEEEVTLSQQKFVEMMLLDGCFIVEFLRKYEKMKKGKNVDEHHDSIFKIGWILRILRRDLLLFENQIPFFILVNLFDMTKIPNDDQGNNLISLALYCLSNFILVADRKPPPDDIPQPVHLLSLMYQIWFCSSSLYGRDDDENGLNSDWKKRLEFSCINLGKLCCDNNTRQQQKKEGLYDIVFIKSVSELKQYGIEFVKSEQSTSLLDIKFENGEIRIPPLVIADRTETIFRNLIAYEQYMFNSGYCGKFVTDYATFMDCLINTPMDVQELRIKGIIENWLGDDKEITDMFNKICNNIDISSRYFTYRKIFNKVNEHCNNRCNSWISDLKKMYFKNPWKIISLSGAIILLILTFIQTVFSILK